MGGFGRTWWHGADSMRNVFGDKGARTTTSGKEGLGEVHGVGVEVIRWLQISHSEMVSLTA